MNNLDISTNLAAVIIAAFTLIGTLVNALLIYKGNRKIDAVADGMQSKMIDAKQAETTAVAHAEGLAAGEAKEQARAQNP